jgi:hypothetical protein
MNAPTYKSRLDHPRRCTARRHDGQPCQRYAARGGNVCRVHGGAAPQVVAAAQRRLQAATDALAAKLLGIALDEGTSESVRLQAIKDALDRGGVTTKQSVAVEVKQEPWEEVLGDVMQITKAQHEAMKRGEYQPATLPDPPALPPAREPMEVVDAEVVPDAPESPAPADEDHADRPPTPEWAEPAPASPTRQLVPLEQATAEAAAANRAARVSQAHRKPR